MTPRLKPAAARPSAWRALFGALVWLDGSPLLPHIEPYRLRLFEQVFDHVDADGRPAYNLVLTGRGKKNAKTLDLVLAALVSVLSDSPAGHDSDCYLIANDEDQAGDDLGLAKKLVKVNPLLQDWLIPRRDRLERRDGRGFLVILPAGDAVGAHGKSYQFCGYDELHGHRNWDVLEAMQPDPNRPDALQWIASYASLFHRPGAPLYDLCRIGRAGSDARMLFSWYAADYTTDPAFAECPPEVRANPSMASWKNPGYLAQQQARLPAHKYRRLHLNLPGLPEGSAFQPDPVMDAIARGIRVRPVEADVRYTAFVDMSGGSHDDAVLGIAHLDADDRAVLDRLVDQGARAPFDPRRAVGRFVAVLREYGVTAVTGDKYAGETFKCDFEGMGVRYETADRPKSDFYEAAEPLLNGHRLILLDEPKLEQQLLGLVWRGGRIDHQNGEFDDYANAACGVLVLVAEGAGAQGCAGVLVPPRPDAPTARDRHARFHIFSRRLLTDEDTVQ